MSDYAFAITKRSDFQGGGEEWSNVWTVSTEVGESLNDAQVISQLVAFEKKIHSTDVTFVRASSYGIGGPDATNVMREIQDLTGTGALGTTVPIYKECALLVKFDLPRSLVLRRKRQAKKWFHICAIPNVGSNGTNQAKGSHPFDAALQTWFRGHWTDSNLHQVLSGGGRLASASDPWPLPVIHPFLEHRQFHRGRKES